MYLDQCCREGSGTPGGRRPARSLLFCFASDEARRTLWHGAPESWLKSLKFDELVLYDGIRAAPYVHDTHAVYFFLQQTDRQAEAVIRSIRQLRQFGFGGSCTICFFGYRPDKALIHTGDLLNENLTSLCYLEVQLVPLDADLFSLESNEHTLRNLQLEGDDCRRQLLSQVSNAVVQLESIFGQVTVMTGYGSAGVSVVQQLEREQHCGHCDDFATSGDLRGNFVGRKAGVAEYLVVSPTGVAKRLTGEFNGEKMAGPSKGEVVRVIDSVVDEDSGITMHCLEAGGFLPECVAHDDATYIRRVGSREILKFVRWVPESVRSTGLFGRLVVIDRAADLVSPLISQRAFGGLVSEVGEILSCHEMGCEHERMEQYQNSVQVASGNTRLWHQVRDLGFQEAIGTIHGWVDKHQSLLGEIQKLKRQNTAGGVEVDLVRNLSAEVSQSQEDEEALWCFNHLATSLEEELLREVAPRSSASELFREYFGQGGMKRYDQMQMQKLLYADRLYRDAFSVVNDACAVLVRDHILNMVLRGDPYEGVVSLICLAALTNQGVPKKHYKAFERALTCKYGYKSKILLRTLADLNFFTEVDSFKALDELLHLTQPDPDIDQHEYYNIAYWNYAPMSARLIDTVVLHKWHNVASSLKNHIPGGTYETVLKGEYSQVVDFLQIKPPPIPLAQAPEWLLRQHSGSGWSAENDEAPAAHDWRRVDLVHQSFIHKKRTNFPFNFQKNVWVVLACEGARKGQGAVLGWFDSPGMPWDAVRGEIKLSAATLTRSGSNQFKLEAGSSKFEFKGINDASAEKWIRLLAAHVRHNKTNLDQPCELESLAEQSLRRLPMVVFFVGGVNMGELTAIREIAAREHRQIVVLTTGMITGSSMLSAVEASR